MATTPSNATKTSGILYLLKINTSGNNSSPTWTTVGSQTTAKMSFKNKAIDVTGKDDAGWDANIPGQSNWTLTCDSFLLVADAGVMACATAAKNRTPVYVELTRGDGQAYAGNAILEGFDVDAPMDKGAMVNLSLTGDQALDSFAI